MKSYYNFYIYYVLFNANGKNKREQIIIDDYLHYSYEAEFHLVDYYEKS